MGEYSKIEWTDHTFNPWIGCQHVSLVAIIATPKGKMLSGWWTVVMGSTAAEANIGSHLEKPHKMERRSSQI